ncbi:MAG: LysM peptidoglycan-binding domain-containing protein [Gammaproteobacteria bacterium]|nr:LysM peptidoglycan-binding domain-containing protein [Gammaproteobacteria bacterium]
MKRIASLALAAMLLPLVLAAETIELKPDHPDRYVVEKGDTLWDISAKFLKEPWLWPEIWEVNPQIENPHLIFPGDEVYLRFVDGQPVLSVRRGEPGTTPGEEGSGTVRRRLPGGTDKLSPAIRESEIAEAIPTIPVDTIRQFLQRPRLVTKREMNAAPYVVSVGTEALIGKPGEKIYVRGINGEAAPRYAIYRLGQEYVDPDRDNEVLGFEAIHIADGVLEDSSDPATMLVTSAQRELLAGDRLLPIVDEEVFTTFMPRAPEADVSGQIISVFDGVSQIGQFQVVVLNLGLENGIEIGHVMAVYQRGETIEDRFASKKPDEISNSRVGIQSVKTGKEKVTLPDERAGIVMVFRSFERLSFALVMEATRSIHVHDPVRKP